MSESINLVPLGKEHIARTLVWMNDPEMMRLLHREHIITEEEHVAWSQKMTDDSSVLYFAIEAGPERRYLGNVWLAQIDLRNFKAEVRVLLGETQGSGHGSKAIALLAEYAFSKLGLNRLYAYVLDFNPRAVRAFEKAGFAKEGLLKDDRKSAQGFHDAWILSRVHRNAKPCPSA